MIFFPTYASYDQATDTWSVDVHAWAYQVVSDSRARQAVSRVFRRALGLKREDVAQAIYHRRASLFLADAVRRRPIAVRLGDRSFALGRTKRSGHLEATLTLPGSMVRAFAGDSGRLRLEPADAEGPPGVEVRLIGPTGVSVISDIDDTIKVSYAWKKRKLIRTTFTRHWKPTRGLAELYGRWAEAGVEFHYVSTSPWQLFPALAQFGQQAGYPGGTYHLKRFRWKDRSFLDLFAKARKYKPRLIEPILQRFGSRRFVLIGDSGEADAEIYGDLARRYPDQVAAVMIRQVSGRAVDRGRLERAFAGLADDRWQVFAKVRHIEVPSILADPAAGAQEASS